MVKPRVSSSALRPDRKTRGVHPSMFRSDTTSRLSDRLTPKNSAATPLMFGGKHNNWTNQQPDRPAVGKDQEAPEKKKELKKNRSDERKYKGVCITCKHREHCERSTIQEGVWHCDKYE